MTTPSGLDRFQRSMVSKRADKCGFCGTATTPGIDFAVLNNGKWMGVCSAHSVSVTEQAKALLLLIQSEAVAYKLDAEAMAAVSAHTPANLADVLAGNATIGDTIAAATALTDALQAVRTFKPIDPIVGRLHVLLAGTTATAWERDFATSILGQVQNGKSLSDKQMATIARILDGQSTGIGGHRTPNTCEPVDGGIYLVGDAHYLVHESKKGNLYAMILASAPVEGAKLDWQYNPGGIQTIRRSGRAITAEEAAALGHTTSYCCFCSRELRDEGEGRSVDVGYGPVCGPKYGLPWG